MSEFANLDVLVTRPPNYHSYLLRFWEERGETDSASIWRFMLEDPQTAERFGFATLDALVHWIHEKIMPHDTKEVVSPHEKNLLDPNPPVHTALKEERNESE
jgi:hypothetical protein